MTTTTRQNHSFTLCSAVAKALLLFTDKKDVRPQLQGLRVEYTPRTTRVIASDGPRVGIYDYTPPTANIGTGAVTIPREVLEALKSSVTGTQIMFDCVTNTVGPEHTPTLEHYWTARASLLLTTFKTYSPESLRYPDFTRCITDTTSGETAQYNGTYLADFDKAAKLLNGGVPYLKHNGTAAGIVLFPRNKNFLGVIMPINHSIYAHNEKRAQDDVAMRTYAHFKKGPQ